MGGGAWWAAVHGVAKSRTRLGDFTFTFHFPALEKEMAPHSSVTCLENPRDGGAWWAAACGVAESDTPDAAQQQQQQQRQTGAVQHRSGTEPPSTLPFYTLDMMKSL